MRRLALAAALVLTGCGVDGPPVTPSAQAQPQPQPGVTITGDGAMGVVFTP